MREPYKNVFPSKITPQIFHLYFFCIYCFPDCYSCPRQQWLVLCLSVFGEMSSTRPVSPGRVPSEAKRIMVCVGGEGFLCTILQRNSSQAKQTGTAPQEQDLLLLALRLISILRLCAAAFKTTELPQWENEGAKVSENATKIFCHASVVFSCISTQMFSTNSWLAPRFQ